MPNHLSEAGYELRRILVDEGPQPRRPFVTRLCSFIPPGKAHRLYVQRLGKVENRFNWTEEQRIASGARTMIDGMLHSAIQRQHVLQHEENGEVYYSISDYGRAVFERFYRRAK